MQRGERLRELFVGGSFLLLAVLLAVLAEPERSWDVPRAVLLVAAFAVAARIELDVGAGYTVPTQLVFVPMLLLLPTPWVPLLVAAGWFLGKLPDALSGRIPFERVMLGIGNSWFALGLGEDGEQDGQQQEAPADDQLPQALAALHRRTLIRAPAAREV